MRPHVLCALAIGLLACSGRHGIGFDDGGDGDDGGTADDSGLIVSGDANEGGSMLGCSGDLRNIIDGNGAVVMMCPPDQGCAGGQCVPACDAAAASKGSIGCDYQ